MSKPIAALRVVSGLMAAALAAGCASEGDRQHPLSEGWHYATIFRIDAEFEAMHPAKFDCRLEDGGSGSRYAEVDYRDHRMLRHRIVRLPVDGLGFHVGDKVYVNVLDCSVPIARRD